MSNETPTRLEVEQAVKYGVVTGVKTFRGGEIESVMELYAPYMAELQELRQRVGSQRLAAQAFFERLKGEESTYEREIKGAKAVLRAIGLEVVNE